LFEFLENKHLTQVPRWSSQLSPLLLLPAHVTVAPMAACRVRSAPLLDFCTTVKRGGSCEATGTVGLWVLVRCTYFGELLFLRRFAKGKGRRDELLPMAPKLRSSRSTTTPLPGPVSTTPMKTPSQKRAATIARNRRLAEEAARGGGPDEQEEADLIDTSLLGPARAPALSPARLPAGRIATQPTVQQGETTVQQHEDRVDRLHALTEKMNDILKEADDFNTDGLIKYMQQTLAGATKAVPEQPPPRRVAFNLPTLPTPEATLDDDLRLLQTPPPAAHELIVLQFVRWLLIASVQPHTRLPEGITGDQAYVYAAAQLALPPSSHGFNGLLAAMDTVSVFLSRLFNTRIPTANMQFLKAQAFLTEITHVIRDDLAVAMRRLGGRALLDALAESFMDETRAATATTFCPASILRGLVAGLIKRQTHVVTKAMLAPAARAQPSPAFHAAGQAYAGSSHRPQQQWAPPPPPPGGTAPRGIVRLHHLNCDGRFPAHASSCARCGKGSYPNSVGHRAEDCHASPQEVVMWIEHAVPVQ